MPSAPKLSAMCRAGIQPCAKAFGGPPKRPSTTAKDATEHLTGLTNTGCRIGLPLGDILKIPGRQTLFIYSPWISRRHPDAKSRVHATTHFTSSLVVPVRLVARAHVEIIRAKTAGPIRVEEKRFSIRRQCRGAVEIDGVHGRPNVHRRRPGVQRRLASRNPQVPAPDSARPIRREDDFQPVMSDGGASIPA